MSNFKKMNDIQISILVKKKCKNFAKCNNGHFTVLSNVQCIFVFKLVFIINTRRKVKF